MPVMSSPDARSGSLPPFDPVLEWEGIAPPSAGSETSQAGLCWPAVSFATAGTRPAQMMAVACSSQGPRTRVIMRPPLHARLSACLQKKGGYHTWAASRQGMPTGRRGLRTLVGPVRALGKASSCLVAFHS